MTDDGVDREDIPDLVDGVPIDDDPDGTPDDPPTDGFDESTQSAEEPTDAGVKPERSDVVDERDPSQHTGTKLADGLAKLGTYTVMIPVAFTGRVVHTSAKTAAQTVDWLPFMDRPYSRLATWSLNRMYKNTDGDAVGAVINEDLSIEFEPTQLQEADVDTEAGEVTEPGWTTNRRETTWRETAQGRDIARVGQTPLVFLPETSKRRVAPLEAKVQTAIETGNWQHVFRVEDPNAVQMNTTLYMAENSGEAVADGGYSAADVQGYDAQLAGVESAVLEDTLVDISDPQRISLSRLRDTYREEGDHDHTDEVGRLNFEAGRAAAEDVDVIGKIVKVLLAVAALLAVVIIGPDLMGGGGVGGGMGGVSPIMIGLGGLI